MNRIIIITLLLTMLSCSKDEKGSTTFLECTDINGGYKEYNGEDIECQFHFVLTEYDNQQYIELIAHCADLTRPHVINENCEDICETDPYSKNSPCGQYLEGREIMDIILIEK